MYNKQNNIVQPAIYIAYTTNNLIPITNIYHRKSDLFKISFKNSERISGYLEAFLPAFGINFLKSPRNIPIFLRKFEKFSTQNQCKL
jgi:hypothetical protein